MLKLSLLAIFFALASANLGMLSYYRNESLAAFQCFAKANLSLVVSVAWDQVNGPASNFSSTVNNARMAGIPNHDAIVTIGDLSDPERICKETVNVLPADFNGTVWISPVYDFHRAVEDRMSYLDNVIRSCQQHGLKLGIHASLYQWQRIFKDQFASSDVVQTLPLFYSNDDRQANFDDFKTVSFGKWTAPVMKDFTGLSWLFCYRMIGKVFY